MARRWWWLLPLGTLLFGSGAYLLSAQQQPLYSARVTLQVNPPQNGSSSLDYNALQGTKSLAETYRQLITTRAVLEPVIASLKLPYTFDELQKNVSAATVGDTQLLRVAVSDPDPQQAAKIANAIADQFVAHTEARSAELAGPYRATLDQQIAETSQQIGETQRAITALQQDPNAASSAIQNQVNDLRAQLAQLQDSYRSLIVTANEMDRDASARKSQVTIEDQAIPPDAPYSPRTLRDALLGAVAGLVTAAGVVALLEYLDNTVKPTLDFSAEFGAPLLASVRLIPHLHRGKEQLFMQSAPRSTQAEAMRLLRTNLDFAAATHEIATFAVTSANPGEGKSTVAANLAVAIAQAGFATVLIDADLRNPSQQRIWSIANERGLSNLLIQQTDPWQEAAQMDILPNLAVMTSGPIPPNPADLLSLDRFKHLLGEISQEADVVILDTPPVLAVSDPLVIANNVDGVVMVAHAAKTRMEAFRHALAMVSQHSSHMLGIVLNMASARNASTYYYYADRYGSEDAAPTSKAALEPAPSAHHFQSQLVAARRLGTPAMAKTGTAAAK